MKTLFGAFNQEKALVGAFSVIVQPVVEPMEHYTALLKEKLSRLEEEKKMLETENLELRHLLDHSDDEDIPDSGFRSQQVR